MWKGTILCVLATYLSTGASAALPIHGAAANGDVAKVKTLLNSNPSLVNATDTEGATPLHHAVAAGSEEIVELLFSKGADVNAKKKDGVTPLHVATALRQLTVAETLVSRGANLKAVDSRGRTPLSIALKCGDADMAALLSNAEISDNGGDKTHAKTIAPSSASKQPFPILAISAQYDGAGYFYRGLAPVRIGSRWGFIDSAGKEVIPSAYDGVQEYHSSMALVMGNIELTLKGANISDYTLIPFECGNNSVYADGLAAVCKSGLWGFLDTSGREIFPTKYNFIMSYSGKLAPMRLNSKVGYVNTDLKMVLPAKYAVAGDFHDGVAPVMMKSKWGYIDYSGKQVIPFKYDDAKRFSGKIAAVGIAGKYGFIDARGHIVIPLRYSGAKWFTDGMAPVQTGSKWGFIDSNGKEVIPPTFSDANPFSEMMAAVKLNGKWGYMAQPER